MFPGRRVLACALALLLLLATGVAGAAAPRAVAGHIELPANLQRPVLLRGEWGFAWHRFVDPHWERLPASAFAPAATSWNELTVDGKPAGPDGWGSYVLQVDCPAGEALAVEAVPQRTASRLYVNGELVAAHGLPGPSYEASAAAVYRRVPISHEFACPLRITVHLSNFDHRAGGFVRPLVAGPDDALAAAREGSVAWHGALLAAYLLTGAVALIFHAVRRRERVPLIFGLFCIAMAVYADMIGERLLLRALPGQIPWAQYMRIEYLSWMAAMALFLVTLRALFPAQIQRRVVQAVLATLGVAALSVFVLRPGVYSHVAMPGEAIAVVVGGYIVVRMLRVQGQDRVDARVLLAGLLAVVATLAIDLLLIDTPGPDRKFAPFGFALFLLSPAIVIARRMSQAMNAEERSLTLEENARLREDVERMSRHDLKTPLNSVLGASRLLRDDAKLTADQRELVGVIQRAGMRMLEMVNLSLGLFRMERGTYEFRPQAVDLRELVTRVMVDLQSYADAHSVTLHLQGSEIRPVVVRAEELLCYSILANVLRNAIEAAGPGRQVSIAIRRGDPVAVAVHNPGEVPPGLAPRFFEKYVTQGKSGGTGLGTYSSRLMARVQQGDLQLRTGAAEGTTLTLTLKPVTELPARAAPVRPTPAVPAQWAAGLPVRHVLIVDDDEYTRLVMRRFVPSPPFEVETAANGTAAVDAMTRRWPDYLLIDMEMPFRNGLDTVRWVREHEATQQLARCRVIMWSGNDDEASAARAREAGADRFLVKPVGRDVLVAAILELESGAAALPTTEAAPLDTDPGELAARPESGSGEVVILVDPEWKDFLSVFPEFLRTQRDTVDAMARALAAGDREEVRFLAHRIRGGLLMMGVHWAARQSRVIEQGALNAAAPEIERTILGLRDYLKRVRFAAS